MSDPLFVRRDSVLLCDKIRAYWAKHGISVKPYIVEEEFRIPDASRKSGYSTRTIYSIRSDLQFQGPPR